MKINKNSWHYEILNRYGRWPLTMTRRIDAGQVNLCEYVCAIGWALIKLFMIATGVLFYGMCLVTTVNFFITGMPPLDEGGELVLALGMAPIIIAFILFVVWAWVAFDEKTGLTRSVRNAFRPNRRTIEKKEPGLIYSWYRAWKDKFCPIVEFDEDQ